MKQLIRALKEAHGRHNTMVIKQMTLIDEALISKINRRLTTKFPEHKISFLNHFLLMNEDIGARYYAIETTESEGSVTIVECDGNGVWHVSLETAEDNESPKLIEALLNVADYDDQEARSIYA